LLATTVIVSPSSAETLCKPASQAAKQAAWEAYRERFPFLMQGVARMEASKGCTVLVIAEPPPAVTIPSLVAEIDVAEQPDQVLVKQNPFGMDGWTRDLVVTIDSDTAEQAANTISLLHRYLFGTSYRAWTVDLDAPATKSAPASLSLNVTGGDLRAWMYDARTVFTPLFGGATRSGGQLSASAPLGVYEATSAPLVAWVLDIKLDLAERAAEARQFTMASDLILGGVLSNTRVVVIGRSRSVPNEVLPPLRTETLQLLIDADDSLAQSYERKSPLAGAHGPMSAHLTSWAPIYLSPKLVDTEYGALLNLTDQLLKSWSNAGKTRYTDFAYPDPPHWPFAQQPVYQHLGLAALTYNWNTKAFASAYVGERDVIVSFQSTGALPLDYLPGDRSTAASEKASQVGRAYFAQLGDPNLVRVVQYADMYHIFQSAKTISGAAPRMPTMIWGAPSSRRGDGAFVKDAAFAMLQAFAQAPDAKLRELAGTLFDVVAPQLPAGMTRSALADVVVDIRRRSAIAHAAEPQLRAFAALWAAPPVNPTAAEQRTIDECNRAKPFMQGLVDIAELRQDFLATLPPPRARWIHTSTWVSSTNDSTVTGGHNLDFALHEVHQLPPARSWKTALAVGTPREPAAVPRWGGWHGASAKVDKAMADYGSAHVVPARLVRGDGSYRVSLGGQTYDAWTVADVSDVLANAARGQEPSKVLRLHLEGFSADEARAVRVQTERAISTSGRTRTVETVAFRRANAEITRGARELRSLRELAAEEPVLVSDNVVETGVAAKPQGRFKAFVAKVRVVFQERVSEPMRARVASWITSVTGRFGRTGTAFDVSAKLQRDLVERLKAEGVNASVELINEAEDGWFVEREPVLVPRA